MQWCCNTHSGIALIACAQKHARRVARPHASIAPGRALFTRPGLHGLALLHALPMCRPHACMGTAGPMACQAVHTIHMRMTHVGLVPAVGHARSNAHHLHVLAWPCYDANLMHTLLHEASLWIITTPAATFPTCAHGGRHRLKATICAPRVGHPKRRTACAGHLSVSLAVESLRTGSTCGCILLPHATPEALCVLRCQGRRDSHVCWSNLTAATSLPTL